MTIEVPHEPKRLKRFASWARNHLREQVTAKAARLGITPKGIQEPQFVAGGMTVAGFTYDARTGELYRSLRADLNAKLQAGASTKEAVEALIDEMAYTHFNRFTALRFMEVNGYIGRVLSSSTPGMVDPDLLRNASSLVTSGEYEGVTLADLDSWRRQGDDEAYRNLLALETRNLARTLPFLFGEGKDYAALFLPDHLLGQTSVIRRLVSDIPEEDWQSIEIIGWLYQFYISERKDEVIGAKSVVAARDIPAATQLFTPHWIVRYMVENSLGRLWLESHPDSKLREHMPYYLESTGQNTVDKPDKPLQPQDLTVMDPACGSGHILVYAFDLLYRIYQETGYPERDIPALILEHNLFGFDIDKTAPTVSLLGDISDGASFVFGSVPATPTCAASDALSGLAGACSMDGYKTTVGTHTVTAKAGNEGTASLTYTVTAWTISGYHRPVETSYNSNNPNGNTTPVYNGLRNGASVPMKFNILAGSTPITSTSNVTMLVSKVSCEGGAPIQDIPLSETTTGQTSLRYDATEGQFIYNWQSPKQANSCYRIRATATDGSYIDAFYRLR